MGADDTGVIMGIGVGRCGRRAWADVGARMVRAAWAGVDGVGGRGRQRRGRVRWGVTYLGTLVSARSSVVRVRLAGVGGCGGGGCGRCRGTWLSGMDVVVVVVWFVW